MKPISTGSRARSIGIPSATTTTRNCRAISTMRNTLQSRTRESSISASLWSWISLVTSFRTRPRKRLCGSGARRTRSKSRDLRSRCCYLSVALTKDPMRVDSGLLSEAEWSCSTHPLGDDDARSKARRSDRHPYRSWRDLRLIGTQSFNLAGHLSLAGWRGEDVKTFCFWRRHFGAVDVVLAAHREGP